MKLQRTVRAAAAPQVVFAYLSDFTTTNEWDPGTVQTTLVSGDGGLGTTYDNTSRFLGRKTEITYEVVTLDPDRLFVLRGENETVVATDTIEVAPNGTGSSVTYGVDFAFKGVLRLVAPLLAPGLKKFGDDAARHLQEALAKL